MTGKGEAEDSREGPTALHNKNSLHNTNEFPREFHDVYVINYITQMNSPEKTFLYVMIFVPTVFGLGVMSWSACSDFPMTMKQGLLAFMSDILCGNAIRHTTR